MIDSALGGNFLLFEFYHCKWVEITGTMYKTGCYLMSGLNEDCSMPLFMIVSDILVRNQGDEIIMFGGRLLTISFDCHYHAWGLKRYHPKQYACCNLKTLKYYLPHSLQSISEDKQFITLRHKV